MRRICSYIRNSLPEKTRIEIATSLQARLVDSIDLMMQKGHRACHRAWRCRHNRLFTLVSCGTDTNLWFVEAHEQSEI